MVLGIVGLIIWAIPADSALRGPDMIDPEVMSLTSFYAPLMQAIVPLIFVLLLIPGVVYGFASDLSSIIKSCSIDSNGLDRT